MFGHDRSSQSMEPMTMGSPPPSSPAPPTARLGGSHSISPVRYHSGTPTQDHHGGYHSSQHHSQFAPSFLLGGCSSGGSGAGTPQSGVGYNRQESSSGQPPNPFATWRAPSADHVTFTGVNKYSNAAERRTRGMKSRASSRDQFGPPTKSICFDQNGSAGSPREFDNGNEFQDSSFGTSSFNPSQLEIASPMLRRKPFGVGAESLDRSVAQADPFYTQGDTFNPAKDLDETWITVFGFPPSASKYIVDQFSQYGTIVHYEVSSKGNWMHVHYQTKIQSSKALSKNGKIYDESLQIGVTPCIEKEIIARYRNKPPTCDSSMGGPSSGIPRTALFGSTNSSSFHEATPFENSPYASLTATASAGVDYSDSFPEHHSLVRPLTPINQRKLLANPIRRVQSFKDASTLSNSRRVLPIGNSPLAMTKPTIGSAATITSPAKAGIKSLTAAYEKPSQTSSSKAPDRSIISKTLNSLIGW